MTILFVLGELEFLVDFKLKYSSQFQEWWITTPCPIPTPKEYH